MQKLAVMDIKENFCYVSVFSEGWNSNTLLGTATVRGSFIDRTGGTAYKVREETESISLGMDAVILLLPRSLVQILSMELPARNERTLARMMGFEAGRHFPIPMENLAYDYFPTEKKGDKFILNLAGLKKSEFDAYTNAALEAGIRPDIVSVSSSAWLAATGAETGKRTFIEIAPDGFEMSLLDGNRIAYSRFVRFRPAIEEKYFHNPGYSSETISSEIVGALDREINHIRLVSGVEGLTEYLKEVALAGGGFLRKRVIDRLSMEKDFSSSKIDPLPADDREPGLNHTSVTVGSKDWDKENLLFNFIPEEERKPRHDVAKRRMQFMMILAAFLLVVWGASSFAMQYRALNGVKAELGQLKKETYALDSAEIQIEEMTGYFNGFNSFVDVPAFTLRILEGLTKAISRNTFITELEMRKGEIVIAGLSGSSSGLLKNLEGSRYFKNVRMEGAVKAVGSRERFKIRMELE